MVIGKTAIPFLLFTMSFFEKKKLKSLTPGYPFFFLLPFILFSSIFTFFATSIPRLP